MLPRGLQIKTHLRGNHTDAIIELERTRIPHGSAHTVITYNTQVEEQSEVF